MRIHALLYLNAHNTHRAVTVAEVEEGAESDVILAELRRTSFSRIRWKSFSSRPFRYLLKKVISMCF